MNKNAVIALSIVLLAVAAVFFITHEPKDPAILAALDKTNYNSGKPAGGGLTSFLSTILGVAAV
jgi:hypothetical protein